MLKKDAARIRKEAFSHSLNRALSIHVQGLRYEVQTSDGASVGYNRDSTTKNQILYTWYADKEGVYSFQDMGDTRSSEEGTNVHGLFGAIIIEPSLYAVLDVHNEKSDNVDYKNYVLVDKNGDKYVTGSESFWTSFMEIAEEMEDAGEEYAIKAYRVPSKNYKGKEFLTCSVE